MSISLTEYPVYTDAEGNTINIFPGYLPIELEFKREDIAVISVTSGSGTNILVKIAGDLTSIITVGDGIYVYSEGDDFIYNDTGNAQSVVLNGANTDIEIDIDFIEIGTGGYLNYKQNYSVECKLISVENTNIDLLGFSLFDDGTSSGELLIDTSIIVDLTRQEIIEVTRVATESRIKYNVKYREVWKDNESEVFTALNNPIIALYATKDLEQATFTNPITIPKYYLGYTQGLGYLHSDADITSGDSVRVLYDELDINKDDITSDNLVKIFDQDSYGLLFSLLPSITNSDVKYIRMKSSIEDYPEYEPTEYENTEYET